MNKKVFTGAGGPDQPKNTADNLRSEDIVEFALAVSEGPIRGLTDGAKSFYVGDTPLVNAAGVRNFEKFAIGVHPGYAEGSARPLDLKLGGVTSNITVSVPLVQNTPVTRETSSSLRGAIDEIEVRILFARLLKANDGSTDYNDAHFAIQYKRIHDTDWLSFMGEAGDGGVSSVTHFSHTGGDGGSGIPDSLAEYLVTVGQTVTVGQPIARVVSGDYGNNIEVKANANGVIATLPLALGNLGGNTVIVATILVTGDVNAGELVVNGKTISGYVKEFRASVPRITDDDWTIRVTKFSPDNDEHNVVEMSWESFQCTTRGAITYPDTAIIHGLGVANGQFSSIPDFGGVYDGLMIRVPTNYNPDLRTYDDSTPWNGSFKFAWTNNPAWVLYDLITNTRYGLAKHRRYIDANRFTFYEAARWCDVPVTVGSTTRPRYTYNDIIADQRPAMDMLQYVAGSFNALVWDDLQGQIHLRVDKDDPASQVFTPENITDDGFQYTFTDITTRANDISVSFINPQLDWNEDRRRIPNVTTNEAAIEKFGRIPLDFIAVGCTNADEAIAKARVRLISSQTETIMVSFTTTRQGALVSLYDVILIADPVMGWSQSGRLTHYDASRIYFRDAIFIETIKTYVVKIQTPLGLKSVNVVPEQIGHVNSFLLQDDLPPSIPRYTVFTVEETGGFGFSKPFRVLGIEEVEGSPYLYKITAVEINRNKYLEADGGATELDEITYSYKQPYLPGQPTNFVAESGDEHLLVMPSGEVVSRIFVSWRRPFGSVVKRYELQWKLFDAEAWQSVPTQETSAYLMPVTPGVHYALRVASIDPQNRQSAWVIIKDYTVIGKQKVPANVTSFTATGDVFQNLLSWTFNSAPDIKKVEIWAGTVNLLSASFKLTDLSYPTSSWTHLGLDMGVLVYYWIRVQDTSGNYSAFSSPARSAAPTTDPSRILAILEHQISETQLLADLNSRIDLIDGPISMIGSVARQIKDEQDARIAGILAEAVARGAAITTEQTVRQAADSSLASSVTTLTASTNNNAAAIQNEVTTRTTADTAITTAATALTTRVGNAESAIATETTTRANQNSATALTITQMQANIATNSASITNEAGVRAAADSATAVQVSTLSTTVAGHTASITNTTTAVNGLYAQQYIKTDVNGFVSGYGLASTGATSIFIVNASTFAFSYPGQTSKFPFMIGLVNGVSTVGINGALVVDGTLTVKTANIGDANITTLKIAGEAVLLNRVVSSDTTFNGNGGSDVSLQYTTALDSPARIAVMWSAYQSYGSGIREWGATMEIAYSGGSITANVIGGLSVMDTPSMVGGTSGKVSGPVTVTITYHGQDSGVRLERQRMLIFGVKN